MSYREVEAPSLISRAIPVFIVACLIVLAWLLTIYAPVESLAGVAFLFLTPAALGACAVAISGASNFSLKGCFGPPVLLILGLLIAARILNEGIICIAMVAAAWLLAAIGGGLVTVWFRWQRNRRDAGKTTLYSAVWISALAIAALLAEPASNDDIRIVSRSVVLDAPAREVWPQLLSIKAIRPDEGQWNMSQDVLGVPRPTSASLERRGGRLVRLARWGEGLRFEERIVAIRPQHSIEWRFEFPDTSLRDHTDRHIDPRSDTLEIQSGGYRMEALGPAQTRVTLWTKYRQRVRLPFYTAWWGERFLGDIQSNILAIIAGRVS